MKKTIFTAIFIIFISFTVFCNGHLELANTQEIGLENIIDVKVLYSSEKVSLFMGTTDTLIIKEYMSENKNKYFAKITNFGNTITIENGRWPFRPFSTFNRRLEVYLPASYDNTINIKTSSGDIETSDLFCSKITIKSSSGDVSVKSITAETMEIKSSSGNITIGSANGEISIESSSGRIDSGKVTGSLLSKTSSGDIHCENIQGTANLHTHSGDIVFSSTSGNISAEASSGDIKADMGAGSINAKTTSGKIHCTAAESSGDISLNTTSGSVRLYLPVNFKFHFSSRTSSGRLTTPFSDRLSNPVTDKNLTQGAIGSNNSENIPTVTIRTGSGSTRIEWV